jgi:hypothetical protein
MFVFGHLGIGSALASPWRKRLPWLALLAGTLLPDVIDKPLYYSHLSPYVSCTRTFGHTGLLVLIVLIAARVRRSPMIAAMGIGMITHVLLDNALGLLSSGDDSAWMALTWPLNTFAIQTTSSLAEHLRDLWTGPIVVSEIVGFVLLVWEIRRRVRAT